MRNYVEDIPQIEEQIALQPELHQNTLQELLGLDETMVRLNRAGKLTSDQQNFVREQTKKDDDGTWLLSTIFIGTALLLALIFLTEALSMTPLLFGGGAFLAAFAFYTYNRRQKRERDLATRVSKVKGELRLIKSDRLEQWALVIENKFFPISAALADKLDGYAMPVVAAYYTEGTNTLLSMEVLAFEKRKNDDLGDDDEFEKPLEAWDKPKNQLTLDEASDAKTEPEPQAAQQEQASGSKRRF